MVVIAIVGPTASGKTALGVRLAEQIGGEIISCDSQQVYRELDIGTAKPTAGERARAPHHLVDVVAPDAPFSAARYVELADRAIADVHARGRRAVVVGGTGLYLRALRRGLVDAPPRDDALRARLLADEAAAPGSLHARLAAVDAEAAARLPPRDLVRIVRALEVHALTGVTLSRHHAVHAGGAPRLPMRVAVLDPATERLAARIAARAGAMVTAGLVDETRRLVARYGFGIAPLGAVGYREAIAHLRGELDEDALASAIARATRALARRQRTWFRKEEATRFSDGEQLLDYCLTVAASVSQ
jgi:tRNA dimethylallyltransferase